MKSFNTGKSLVAFALALGLGMGAAGVKFMEPVWAGTGVEAFSDPEFEDALRKHVQKRFFNVIDATDAQKTQLDAIFNQRVTESRSARKEIKQGLIELAQMMADESSTDDQITEKAHQLRQKREQLMDARLSTALKVRGVLSKEQKEVLSERVIGMLSGHAKRGLLRSMLLGEPGRNF